MSSSTWSEAHEPCVRAARFACWRSQRTVVDDVVGEGHEMRAADAGGFEQRAAGGADVVQQLQEDEERVGDQRGDRLGLAGQHARAALLDLVPDLAQNVGGGNSKVEEHDAGSPNAHRGAAHVVRAQRSLDARVAVDDVLQVRGRELVIGVQPLDHPGLTAMENDVRHQERGGGQTVQRARHVSIASVVSAAVAHSRRTRGV